ncbi:MAG: DNA polymerase Y family protein [Acidimicrobiaceae bacterium]|nr:DNA polymerase Y family protein [Acidimicrobiaceae bacterium]
MSRRLAVLHCVDWSAVVAASSANNPCAVVHAQRVISRTPSAMRHGVQVGMRRRHAQALCPDIEIVSHQPNRDRNAFDVVVRAVNELVPLIEVSEPGVIVFAARGPSRYMGGDQPMATKMIATLRCCVATGTVVGVGVADGRLAAHIAAHTSAQISRPYVVEPDKTSSWLAPQSARVLSEFAHINRDTISLLERLGLNTLHDVSALSESVLAGRFGELGVELHRLARGDDQHPLVVVPAPPEHLCVEVFDQPISDQQIVISSVQRMASAFTEYFSQHGTVCVRIMIRFESEFGKRSERLWYQPNGLTASAIVERARWQLESRQLENSSVADGLTRVQLVADELRSDTARQLQLWGGTTQTDETAAQAIGRLSELLGSSAVQIAKWHGGRDPLESYELISATHSSSNSSSNREAKDAVPRWRGALPTPSPSVVYLEPIQVQLNDASGKLLRVSARHELSASPATVTIGSTVYKVVAWAGPWPVEERWWDIARGRRLVRLQLVVEKVVLENTAEISAMLVVLEDGQWTVTAMYG